MKYLLDTNCCIRYLNGRSVTLRDRIHATPESEIAISTVTRGELYAGSAKSQTPERSRARQDAFFIRFASLPFDEAAADAFGRLRARLEMAGMPIGPYDMQIAAVALVHQLIVVTHNTREFSRVEGLQIEDWEV